MDRVGDGSIKITDEDLPSFLYESGTAYDRENEDIGLFRGFLLVRVYRHIFTGPSSALNPTAKINKNKARKFKLTEVTRRTIAYASIQVRGCFSVFISNLFYFSIGIHSPFVHEP